MKRFYVLLLIALLVLVGCKNSENNVEADPNASVGNANVDDNATTKSKGIEFRGEILKSKLSKDIFVVAENWDKDLYKVGDNEYTSDKLLAALNELDKDKLKYGILKFGTKLDKKDTCFPVLEKFCIDNDIDLFTEVPVSKYVPPEEDFVGWAVKSTKTTYGK